MPELQDDLRIIELRAEFLQRSDDEHDKDDAERLRVAQSLCRRGCNLKAALRSVGFNALEISELGLTLQRIISPQRH